jgi:hypothetical protein
MSLTAATTLTALTASATPPAGRAKNDFFEWLKDDNDEESLEDEYA